MALSIVLCVRTEFFREHLTLSFEVNNVAIIGGGLSGSLLALNLLRHACSADSIRIFLIDRRHESDLGPAYSTNEEYLVLNVPASRMGAFPANPEHFLTWAQNNGVPATAWDFLPRKLYREYIQALLEQALRETKGNISLKRIRREVVDMERNGSETEVRMQGDRSLAAHRVVLALGNFPPGNLQIKNRSFLNSERYIQNPWSPGLFSLLREHDAVLLIGTGQTMVDLVISLHMLRIRGDP